MENPGGRLEGIEETNSFPDTAASSDDDTYGEGEDVYGTALEQEGRISSQKKEERQEKVVQVKSSIPRESLKANRRASVIDNIKFAVRKSTRRSTWLANGLNTLLRRGSMEPSPLIKTKKTIPNRVKQKIRAVVRFENQTKVHAAQDRVDTFHMEPMKMPTTLQANNRRNHKRRASVIHKIEEPQVAKVHGFPITTKMINPDCLWYRVWSTLTLPLVMYVATILPFETAFLADSCALFYPNLFVDVYFAVDLLLKFNVARFDYISGRWLTEHSVIALRYLKGWFFIDFLASVPADAFIVSWSYNKGIFYTFVCSHSQKYKTNAIKLARLIRLLRVLRIGRFVSSFASTVNVSFKAQTVIKFGCLIFLVTHIFSCLIRIVGDTSGCRAQDEDFFASFSTESTTYISATSIDDYNPVPACWITSVRFYRRGIWYQYVAALDWSIKAVIGSSIALTFGESCLSFLMVVSGLILTSYLVGEIANVLGNFDPARNSFRSAMDNLNHYLHEQHIEYGLQKQLRDYFLNSETLFRKTYHKSMLENLSPQLRRSVAQAELGEWVLSLPFLNDALCQCGGIRQGVDILYVPSTILESGKFSEDDLIPAQIVAVNSASLHYTLQHFRIRERGNAQSRVTVGQLKALYDCSSVVHSLRFDSKSIASAANDEDAKVTKVQRSSGRKAPPSRTRTLKQMRENDKVVKTSRKEWNNHVRSYTMLFRDLVLNLDILESELVHVNNVLHEQIFMPREQPLLQRRLADANREWRQLVAEFALALAPKMFMMHEFIVRPGSLNDHLYLIMEGMGYVSDFDVSAVPNIGREASGIWRFRRYVTAENHDVIGVDIISTLVGAPIMVDYTATAAGHTFCNVLTATQLENIMTFDAFPKITAETRKCAGWRLLKRGVVRLGHLALQERRARYRYWRAHRSLQRAFLWSKQANRSLPFRPCVPPWMETCVSKDRLICMTQFTKERKRKSTLKVNDHVDALFTGHNYELMRPAIIIGVHAKSEKHLPASYMIKFTSKKQRILHTREKTGKTRVLNLDETLEKLENGQEIDDGHVLSYNRETKRAVIYLTSTIQVVDAESVEPCVLRNSRVKVKHVGQSYNGVVAYLYTDGTYRIVYDHDNCKPRFLSWLFWRYDKPWIWHEADRAIADITMSWQKMSRLDRETQDTQLQEQRVTDRMRRNSNGISLRRLSFGDRPGNRNTIDDSSVGSWHDSDSAAMNDSDQLIRSSTASPQTVLAALNTIKLSMSSMEERMSGLENRMSHLDTQRTDSRDSLPRRNTIDEALEDVTAWT